MADEIKLNEEMKRVSFVVMDFTIDLDWSVGTLDVKIKRGDAVVDMSFNEPEHPNLVYSNKSFLFRVEE